MLATRTVPTGRVEVPQRPRHHRRAWIIAAVLIGLLSTPLPAGSQSADTLHEQATQLYKAGRYADALPFFQRALTLRENEVGTDDPETAQILMNLVQLYWAQGQYAPAVPVVQRALAIREKALGLEHPETADSLHNLGRLHHSLGQHAEAFSAYQRALVIREKALGPEHADTAATLNNLAALYWAQGQHPQAQEHFQRALAIREKTLGPEHRDTAQTQSNLALLLYTQGQYSEALALNQRALAIREKVLGPEHQETAHSLNNLAMVYWAQGRYDQAVVHYERALVVHEKATGPTHPNTATILNDLATLYWTQGRYAQALPHFQRALAIREKSLGPESPLTASSLNALAEIYRAQGQYEQALPLYQRALAINEKVLGPDHRSTASTLNYLAMLYRAQGRYAEALPYYQRALSIREKALGPEHPDTAQSLNNLAVLFGSEGQYEQAMPPAQRALDVRRKVLGQEHPDTAQSLHNVAWIHDRQGEQSTALPLYRQALATRERALGPVHPEVAVSLQAIAGLHLADRGGSTAGSGGALVSYEEALALARRATSIRQSRAADAGREAADRSAAGARSELQSARSGLFEHVRLLAAGTERDARNEASAEAFEVAQLAHASDTAAAVAQMAARFAGGDDELAALARSRQDLVVRLRYLDGELIKSLSRAGQARDATAAERLRGEIRDVEAQLATIDLTLSQRFPDYQVLTGNAPLSLSEAQRLLRPDEAMLSYLVGERESYLWVIRNDRQRLLRLSIGRQELEQSVRGLRRALDLTETQGQLPAYPADLAHELYRAVFAPAVPTLGGATRLLIVADGALQSIPFAILVAEPPAAGAGLSDLAWLAKRYALSSLPSEASLKAMRRFAGQRQAPAPFVGFGAPAFKGGTGSTRALAALYTPRGLADVEQLSELAPLPDSAKEISTIAAALGASKGSVYLGESATEAQVKKLDLSRYRTLAFATHGFTAGELRGVIEPALALTPPKAPTEDDDGLLTASEIARLRLNSDWVILSACNTAAPDGTLAAEGLSGLARAFIFAGSRSLLVSHWPVDSRAAALLTTRMLQELRKQPGIPKDEALRRAMLALMANKAYGHPLFWAPFVMIGA